MFCLDNLQGDASSDVSANDVPMVVHLENLFYNMCNIVQTSILFDILTIEQKASCGNKFRICF